jgi:hypothetical protein
MPKVYPIRSPQSYEYRFTTDSTIEYVVLFSLYDGINDTIFSVVIAPVNCTNPPKDYNVAATIRDVFCKFFSETTACIIYTPDFSDNRQEHRHLLFTRWFDGHLPNEFELISVELEYTKHAVTLYTNLLFRTDYPHKVQVKNAFAKRLEYYQGLK